jgi:large repetitive protein
MMDLPPQEFDLLEGTLAGSFSGIALSISGRTLTLQSTQGSVTFLQQDLQYQDFMVSTAGEFAIGNIGTDGFGLFQEYVVLDGLGVAYDSDEGLSISSNFTVNLPDPVGTSASASINFRRDADSGQISIESEGPDFEFEQESYPIGTWPCSTCMTPPSTSTSSSRIHVAAGGQRGIFYDDDDW